MTIDRVLRSSTFRLALLYMALSVGSVVILLTFLYWATAGYMDRQTDATIEAEIRGLSEQYRRRGLAGLTAVIAERVARDPAGANVYLLANETYVPIVGNLDRWPQIEADTDGWARFTLRDWGVDGSQTRLARARLFVLKGGLHLLVGRDVRDLEATRGLILRAFAWGLAITLGLALGGGMAMSAGVVRRLDAINGTSREIMEGDLSRRIPRTGSGDDFDRLAENLNRMLERIDDLMTGVREVSDNIAHDLRTPLTRLRNRLETALSQVSEPPQVTATVEEAIQDAEELLTTFNALLRIARIEAGTRPVPTSPVDMNRIVSDVAELYGPLAQDRNQSLSVDIRGDAPARGDRDLLFQAVANLVDNAIKYSPAKARIGLSVASDDTETSVTVADSGPGIPADRREKVVQRFYRLDTSRSTPGSGLGLSLVQAVARLHGARLNLADNRPGLRATLALPR